MKVYVDEMFLFNFTVDYLLIYTSALLSSSPVRRHRFLLSAMLGALYSILTLFPSIEILEVIPIRIMIACIMTFTAFGIGNTWKFIRRCAVLFISCFMFAGFFEFLLNTGMFDGYTVPPILVLISIAMLAYILLTFFLRGMPSVDSQSVPYADVHIETESGSADLPVLADTGNRLHDPFTGDAVLIVDLDTGEKLLPCDIFRTLKDSDAVKALPVGGCGYRLIPYKSIGGDGFMLAVRPKVLKVNGKNRKNTLIAFTRTNISDGAGYEGILGV